MSSKPFVKPAELRGRGRALIAARPIKPGDVLFSDSPLLLYPAATAANAAAAAAYCSCCFRSLQSSSHPPPLRCASFCSSSAIPAVASSAFCSPRCQSSHSPALCLALSRLPSSLPPDVLTQTLFLLAAYSLSFSSPPDFMRVLSLQGSASDGDANPGATAEALHSLVASVLPSHPSGFCLDLTAALLAKDRINAFGLMEPFDGTGERRVRAYGIYPTASLFNHDCLPNACRFDYVDGQGDRNTDIVFRALHDIPEGREVCLSYFPVNWSLAERQRRLIEDYGFFCECDRCRVEKEWKDDDEEGEESDGMQENDDAEEGIEEMEEANGDGDPHGDCDDENFPHAYFFVRYLCDKENCGGTLAPLPPSPEGTPSNVMECNVCGGLRAEEDIDNNDGAMLD